MKCPKCQASLEASNFEGGHFHHCPSCGGFWIKHQTLLDLIRKAAASAGVERKALGLIETVPVETRHSCPTCASTYLDAVRFRAVEVERCAECRGVFLDSGELQLIAERVVDAQRQWRVEEAEWSQLVAELKLAKASDRAASSVNLGRLIGVAALLSN